MKEAFAESACLEIIEAKFPWALDLDDIRAGYSIQRGSSHLAAVARAAGIEPKFHNFIAEPQTSEIERQAKAMLDKLDVPVKQGKSSPPLKPEQDDPVDGDDLTDVEMSEKDPVERILDTVAAGFEAMNARIAKLESRVDQPTFVAQAHPAAQDAFEQLLNLQAGVGAVATQQRATIEALNKMAAHVESILRRPPTDLSPIVTKLDMLVVKGVDDKLTATKRNEALKQQLGELRNLIKDGMAESFAEALIDSMEEARLKIELPPDVKQVLFNTDDGVAVIAKALLNAGLLENEGDLKRLAKLVAKRSPIPGIEPEIVGGVKMNPAWKAAEVEKKQ
jgi:hypothetical protein